MLKNVQGKKKKTQKNTGYIQLTSQRFLKFHYFSAIIFYDCHLTK